MSMLRELAEAIEDGGWHNADFLRCFVDDDDESVFSDADAAFIAGANPTAILRLLDALEIIAADDTKTGPPSIAIRRRNIARLALADLLP